MNRSYQITVVESLEKMAELGGAWNALLNESRSNTVFLSWEWLYTWSECFLKSDRRLFVLLIYKEEELVGIAPWCIRHIRSYGFSMRKIEFLGIPETGSDYLDVFAKRGKEKEVAEQIYHFLHNSTSFWDSLALHDLASDSLFLLHFMNQVEKDGKYGELRHGPYCPSIALPQTIDAFKSRLSRNRREQFSRHLRLLRKTGEVTHRVDLSGEVAPVLKDFSRMYEQRWGAADGLFHFLDKLMIRSEEKNWLQLDSLNVGGRNIAGLLHLRYGKTLSMYLMGVDHSFDKSISIGNILVGLSIEKAIAEGFSKYDFLRGDEEYKFHWSNDGKRAVHLYCYGKRAAPLISMTGQFIKSIAKVLMR
ncbi:MAG: GNAT family N-acetyltransferase [Nitrospirae bacterium]|nr:GNAT family N-acetyltransferase [Candidatus Manganitrophaceae bacterium]